MNTLEIIQTYGVVLGATVLLSAILLGAFGLVRFFSFAWKAHRQAFWVAFAFMTICPAILTVIKAVTP